MPIKACADKLTYEITTYGCPPVMPEETEADVEAAIAAAAADAANVDPTQFKASKTKVAAKKGKGATQWAILGSSGIPEDEIAQFQCASLATALSSICSID